MKLTVSVALALLAGVAAMPASSATIFSEDFSGASTGTKSTGAIAGTNFTVVASDVDIVGVLNGGFFNCVANPTGNCVDLVGDRGPGSVLTSTPIALTAGNTYTIAFTDILQGYNAGDGNESDFTVTLGSFVANLASTGAITSRTLSFVAAASNPAATLSFLTTTAPDNVHGAVVSNITIDDAPGAVPEPASWALMLGGFGMIGGVMRRRRMSSIRA